MVEPVNLRKFRKRKLRTEKENQAETNRKIHGISSKLKKQARIRNGADSIRHEGKHLDADD
ncbi:MAG: DUF4169 family protein [Rhizobiaceae bacterium]